MVKSSETRTLEARIAEMDRQLSALAKTVEALQAYTYNLATAARKIPMSPLRVAAWFISTGLKSNVAVALRQLRTYFFLKSSGHFDPAFYVLQTGQHGLKAEQLLRHYVSHGFTEGRDPAANFSVNKYLDFYPDVKSSGIEPFYHYLTRGIIEHRTALPSEKSGGFDGLCSTSSRTAGIEDRDIHSWQMAKAPSLDRAQLGLFDVRPDDDVPGEGLEGADFLARFDLLSSQPDFAGAVASLNALKAKGRIVNGEMPVDVSIIIPVYGELAYTLNCLHALRQHDSRYSFEIIVGDDCSPDESRIWLPQLSFIRHMPHPVNGGFIANCNLTARQARGKTLVMLNNDTRVVSGWLDELIDSFVAFPKAGMVGSKLFYADGKLQEAGGIVWKDGSAWNYGRDDDPNRPRYCYARQVDYVSGCSIALPKKVWEEMGGFDTHFAPAYCEDVDLCFRLRAVGYQTWYQPLSRIIHYEGRTSGTDTGSGIKSYQVANTKKLYERWNDVLALHRPNGESPWLERDRTIEKRVLIIDATNPTPWQDAGSLAITNLFRYYQALGFQASFVPENFLYERRSVSEMEAAGVQCFYAPFEVSLPGLLQKYGVLFDVVHVIRADVAHKSYDLIRSLVPHATAIYQNCDLHFLRMERQALIEDRADLLQEAAAMKIKELQLSRDYDLTITHSEAERRLLSTELPGENIMVIPLIEKVVASRSLFADRKDFMFLGGYGHPPNVDAALWLLDEIWPTITARFPEARLLLVGANPPEEILVRSGDNVVVTGLVDDLAPWFDSTRLFLAALRYGAGAKGKVLASLAHGVPVVATDIAAEGLPLVNDKSIFIANTAEEIINKASQLYALPQSTWNLYSRNATAYIAQNHSFAAAVKLLEKALETKA